MPQRRWSRQLILERIRELRARGSDLTPSRVGAEDGALVSAAARYFGNWPSAVRAAGINYEQVHASGRRRRSERLRKWSRERIVAEIRRLHQAGEDLSWTVMERKYQPLCAAAVKQRYFGSWSAALAAAGIDYEQIKAAARQARRWQARWRHKLAAEGRDSSAASPSHRSPQTPPPTSPPDWSQELLREKAAEEREKREERE